MYTVNWCPTIRPLLFTQGMHQSSCQRVGDTPTENEVIGWQIIRKFYEGKYFSSGTINILLLSWREATSRQYHIFLLKWYTYCWERNINPFSPCLSAVLSFLTLLFSTGIGYSALNTARSAYQLWRLKIWFNPPFL